MGYEFTAVTMKGKLFADTLEGTISVKGKKATLEILSPVGEVIRIMDGEKIGESVLFHLEGMVPGILRRSWTQFINFLQNVSKFCLHSCFFLY